MDDSIDLAALFFEKFFPNEIGYVALIEKCSHDAQCCYYDAALHEKIKFSDS